MFSVYSGAGMDEKKASETSGGVGASTTSMMVENKLHTPCVVPGVPNESENALATYLDVAVMRCLFISHWSEDGFFWALMFLQRRLELLHPPLQAFD